MCSAFFHFDLLYSLNLIQSNERTQEVNELIKLHILWVWQNADESIGQLTN